MNRRVEPEGRGGGGGAGAPRALTLGMVAGAACLSLWLSGQWMWARALGGEGGVWSTAAAALFLPGEVWLASALAFLANVALCGAALGPPAPWRGRAVAWACCSVLGAQMASVCALELSAEMESPAMWAGLAVGCASALVAASRAEAWARRGVAGWGARWSRGLCVALVCVSAYGAVSEGLAPRSVEAGPAEAFAKAVSSSIQAAESESARLARARVRRLARWEAERAGVAQGAPKPVGAGR